MRCKSRDAGTAEGEKWGVWMIHEQLIEWLSILWFEAAGMYLVALSTVYVRTKWYAAATKYSVCGSNGWLWCPAARSQVLNCFGMAQ